MRRKVYTVVVVAILCAVFHLQIGMFATATDEAIFSVDVLLDYGNGTSTWYTGVLSTPGNDTMYNATQMTTASLNVTWFGDDIFVDAINKVWNNWTTGQWWAAFVWNYSSNSWETLNVACNKHQLSEADMVAWFYSVHPWPPIPPANPPITQVDVLLDYNNGTARLYEDVNATGVASAFKAAQAVADLEYSLWGDAIFVDAINGVCNNFTTNYYWIYWFWNFTAGSWNAGPVACNKFLLRGGDVIAWYYETDPWGPPPTPSYNLAIYSSPLGVAFEVDDLSQTSPWTGSFGKNASVSLLMPEIHTAGDARYYWTEWSDGNTNRSRTITMNSNVTLTACFTGSYYEVMVASSPITGITFTINGATQTTQYSEWLLEGSYTIVMPETHNGYVWSHWLEEGDTNRIKTIALPGTTWTAVYTTLSTPVGGTAISTDWRYLASWTASVLILISVVTATGICLKHQKPASRESDGY